MKQLARDTNVNLLASKLMSVPITVPQQQQLMQFSSHDQYQSSSNCTATTTYRRLPPQITQSRIDMFSRVVNAARSLSS